MHKETSPLERNHKRSDKKTFLQSGFKSSGNHTSEKISEVSDLDTFASYSIHSNNAENKNSPPAELQRLKRAKPFSLEPRNRSWASQHVRETNPGRVCRGSRSLHRLLLLAQAVGRYAIAHSVLTNSQVPRKVGSSGVQQTSEFPYSKMAGKARSYEARSSFQLNLVIRTLESSDSPYGYEYRTSGFSSSTANHNCDSVANMCPQHDYSEIEDRCFVRAVYICDENVSRGNVAPTRGRLFFWLNEQRHNLFDSTPVRPHMHRLRSLRTCGRALHFALLYQNGALISVKSNVRDGTTALIGCDFYPPPCGSPSRLCESRYMKKTMVQPAQSLDVQQPPRQQRERHPFHNKRISGILLSFREHQQYSNTKNKIPVQDGLRLEREKAAFYQRPFNTLRNFLTYHGDDAVLELVSQIAAALPHLIAGREGQPSPLAPPSILGEPWITPALYYINIRTPLQSFSEAARLLEFSARSGKVQRYTAVRARVSHLGEPCSVPGGVAPVFTHVGNALDDAARPAGFLGDLPFTPTLAFWRCSILTLLHPHRLSIPLRSTPPRIPYCRRSLHEASSRRPLHPPLSTLTYPQATASNKQDSQPSVSSASRPSVRRSRNLQPIAGQPFLLSVNPSNISRTLTFDGWTGHHLVITNEKKIDERLTEGSDGRWRANLYPGRPLLPWALATRLANACCRQRQPGCLRILHVPFRPLALVGDRITASARRCSRIILHTVHISGKLPKLQRKFLTYTANRFRFPAGSLPDFGNVGIVPDCATRGRVFSGISRFSRTFISFKNDDQKPSPTKTAPFPLLKTIHDKVSTFEINIRKKMERRWNARVEEMGVPRIAVVGGERSSHCATAAPEIVLAKKRGSDTGDTNTHA
ncbi:hypothetical protein PR048_030114 [Dryococelus australis]|uniref:Uncharacterized protein n=1 Tax=Dryococelus australis TaxID=614101 RepID=A0ABQ9GBY1_9NEOP|nr:hypothetical protein PR048_030114 [Dryococelus australis]